MSPIEFLDSLMAGQSKRTCRQIAAVRKWVLAGCEGTIEWPTGVGKTTIATTTIKVMRRNGVNRHFTVVVPRIPLKAQWEKGLEMLGLSENSEVIVINGLVKRKTPIVTDLLILDEVHLYAAKTFAKVFQLVKYEYVLGLTATLRRLDKKHVLLEKYCPIVDRMSLLEARRDKYLANFREYNLGLKMSPAEQDKYTRMYGTYQFCMNKFHQDFDLMLRSSMSFKPWVNISERTGDVSYDAPAVVKYAERLGWRGNTPYQAFLLTEQNRTARRGQRVPIWGGDPDHPYHPQRLYINAIMGMRAIREIKNFVYTFPAKKDASIALLRAFNTKSIVFGETISRVEEIHAELPDSTVMYHSNMTAKEKVKSLKEIVENDEINAILTARALDLGFDYPGLRLGIIESRTSSPTQRTQRRGRVVRILIFEDLTEKEGVMVDIYVMDTKDYDWMRKGQKGSGPVKWVESVAEILRAEGLSVVEPVTGLQEEV